MEVVKVVIKVKVMDNLTIRQVVKVVTPKSLTSMIGKAHLICLKKMSKNLVKRLTMPCVRVRSLPVR